jgi:hypothetical protein
MAAKNDALNLQSAIDKVGGKVDRVGGKVERVDSKMDLLLQHLKIDPKSTLEKHFSIEQSKLTVFKEFGGNTLFTFHQGHYFGGAVFIKKPRQSAPSFHDNF